MLPKSSLLLLLALCASVAAAFGPNPFPRPISLKAAKVYGAALDSAKSSPAETGAPADKIGASGRFVTDIVGYGTKPTHCQEVFYPSFLKAKEEILITTFLFDRTSPCGKIAAKALTDLNTKLKATGGRVRVYWVASTMSELLFWRKRPFKLPRLSDIVHSMHETKPSEFDLPDAASLTNLDFHIKTFHKWILGAVHNKLYIIDGHTFITGSKNWDELPAFEYVAKLEGSIAMTARADFERIWGTKLPTLASGGVTTPRPGEVPMLYLSRISNRGLSHPEDNPQDQAWMKALDIAETSVFIMSPNFTTKTIVAKVLAAVRRGVKVTVITAYRFNDVVSWFNTKSIGNNRYGFKHMKEDLRYEKQHVRDNLVLCYFLGKRVQPPRPAKEEFAHVKFMAIDNEFMIFGSGNQDTQSWYNSSEGNVLVDDPTETVRVVKKLMDEQQTLDHCFNDLHALKESLKIESVAVTPDEPNDNEPAEW